MSEKNGRKKPRKHQQQKNSKERMVSGSSTLNRVKDGSKSKMESGSKDLCGDSTGKNNEKQIKKILRLSYYKNEITARN